MPPEVSRYQLLDIGTDLDWPEVPGLVRAGEEPWQRMILSPPQRVRLLAAVAPLMLSITEAGRARLERWNAHPAPAPARGQLRNELAYFGDGAMLNLIVDTVASLPPCVQEMTVREVAIMGTGWSLGGFRIGAELIGPDGVPRRQLVNVDGSRRDAEVLAYRVRHELGHAWDYADHDGPAAAILAIGREGIEALAREQGWAPRAVASVAQDERRADALALAWQCAATAPR